jgi:tRNA pseudouridine synthase 10
MEREIRICEFCSKRLNITDALKVYSVDLQGSVCIICNRLMNNLERYSKMIIDELSNVEFDSFMVGSKLSRNLIENESEIMVKYGLKTLIPLKKAFNSELEKILANNLNKKIDKKNPDLVAVVDTVHNRVDLSIRSTYIYGEYQKLIRGIPQVRRICRRCKGIGCSRCNFEGKLYKESVQEIIEAPLIEETEAACSLFHGCGREDIDVRNLGWRPFVIELVSPRRRKVSLEEAERRINMSEKVRVRNLFLTFKESIRLVKEARPTKKYLALVTFEMPYKKEKISKLRELVGPVRQRTPTRVLHRRADLIRIRNVKDISYREIDERRIEITVSADSGLYVKEFITGDGGRTSPSVSQLVGCKVKDVELDVIEIEPIINSIPEIGFDGK